MCTCALKTKIIYNIMGYFFRVIAKDDESVNVELFFKKIMGHFEILCKLISIKYTEWVVLVFSFRARIMHFKFEDCTSIWTWSKIVILSLFGLKKKTQFLISLFSWFVVFFYSLSVCLGITDFVHFRISNYSAIYSTL